MLVHLFTLTSRNRFLVNSFELLPQGPHNLLPCSSIWLCADLLLPYLVVVLPTDGSEIKCFVFCTISHWAIKMIEFIKHVFMTHERRFSKSTGSNKHDSLKDIRVQLCDRVTVEGYQESLYVVCSLCWSG